MAEQQTVQDRSLAVEIASLPEEERGHAISKLTDEEAALLLYNWDLWGRPEQQYPKGSWLYWVILAGRGWGKTRTGAETCRYAVEELGYRRLGLVGATAADVRDIMVEGDAGIMAVSPPWNMPNYEPSKRRLTWPNGATATTFSADKPDRLRGPSFDFVWGDELAAWRYMAAWDVLLLCLRLGKDPKIVITTTPRPLPVIKELVNHTKKTHVTRGTSYDNRHNLSPVFFDQITRRYEGTTLGKQELYAQILEDDPDALWRRPDIERYRVERVPPLVRVIVAIDPAVSSGDESSETGIIVAGVGENGDGYVLEDGSIRDTPKAWAEKAIQLYQDFLADRIVAEVNNGGDMVEHTLRSVDSSIPFKKVHATRGKATRAEPVASLYEQGRIHHVGYLGPLEDQLCTWKTGMKSPDRLDALVWALTDLMIDGSGNQFSFV